MSQIDHYYPVRVLENDQVKLIPFDLSAHLGVLYNATEANFAKLCMYLPFGPFKTAQEAAELYKTRIQDNPREFLYAVMVKTAPGTDEIGGTIGLLDSDPKHLVTEIGFVMTIPKFQRTFVTTNAIGLLLQYTLDPPPAGLGLRRVVWQANGANEASIGAAKRMGFTMEGLIRWQRILPVWKASSGDVEPLAQVMGAVQWPGRHSAMLSMCWDDWLVKREEVVRLMERR